MVNKLGENRAICWNISKKYCSKLILEINYLKINMERQSAGKARINLKLSMDLNKD